MNVLIQLLEIIDNYRLLKSKTKRRKYFTSIVSTRKPFGIATDLFNRPRNYGYNKIPTKPFMNSCKIYGVKGNKGGAKRVVGYIDKSLLTKTEGIDKYNVFCSYAYSTTSTVLPQPIIGYPNEACTETFLKIGDFDTEEEALNCLYYITSKFLELCFLIGFKTSRNTFNSYQYKTLKRWRMKSCVKI